MSIANDKVAGLSCFWCGVYFEEENGYPVLCGSCWNEALKRSKNYKIIMHKYGLQQAIHSEL